MNEKYHYTFTIGALEVEKGQADMDYLRKQGTTLAARHHSNVVLRVLNEVPHGRAWWQYLGTYQPDGIVINSFGERCVLAGDHFEPLHKS